MKLHARSTHPASEFDPVFRSIPEKVRKDPFRVGLLPEAMEGAFLKMPMPFPTEFWWVEDEGRPVGRAGVSLSPQILDGRNFAAFGFFEVDVSSGAAPQTASRLIEAAAQWARERGAGPLVGPMNFNTWFPYRFRADTQSEIAPFAWEPVNPPQYVEFFRQNGFEELARYHTRSVDGLDELVRRLSPSGERTRLAGYSLREFDRDRVLEREVPILHGLSMVGFRDNFLFEPIPLEIFRQLYVPLVSGKVDLSLCRFLLDPQGREAGFITAFMERDSSLVLKSMTVLPEHRGKGLSNALFHASIEAGLQRGARHCISALVREGIGSESLAKKSEIRWEHRYALYERVSRK